MSKTIILVNLGLQIAITFVTIFFIYMLLALLDNDFGFDGLLGLFFFQPIFAAIFSSLTIFVCFIAGLPIRLNRKLNYWWRTHSYIAIIGTAMGSTFLLLALLPIFRETVTYQFEGQPTLKHVPNLILSILGWFLATFSLLHFYLPEKLTRKIKILLSN